MFAGTGYNVMIVSPSDISNELKIAESVLDEWNKVFSYDRKEFFFLDPDSRSKDCFQNIFNSNRKADVIFVIFFTESGKPIGFNNDFMKEIEIISRKKEKAILIYFIFRDGKKYSEELTKLKQDIPNYRECSQQDFNFQFSSDIHAFNTYDDRLLKTTIIESAIVDIKVKGTFDECENGQAILTYLGSSVVNSPEKPVRYRDRVMATAGIISKNFTPDATVLNEDQFKRNPTYLDYELVAPDENNKLCFSSKIAVHQKLPKQKGGLGLHIPYFTKHLLVTINISEAPVIYDYIKLNGKAELIYRNQPERIKPIFNKSSMTYTLVLENAQEDSNIAFHWKND